jgi:molybdopterin molybdotransferase
MLDVSAARAIILAHAQPLEATEARLGPDLLGRVVAEGVASDLDSPPFDKSMMDGYAVRSADGATLRQVVEEIPAGTVPVRTIGPGDAARIFTGSPIPNGADAVVMQERVRRDGSSIHCDEPNLRPGLNVIPRGKEMKAGQVVIPTGTVLTPQALGVLASVGRTSVRLVPRASVGIVATGNELVDAEATPGPGQIRNSNGPMLAGQVARSGAVPTVSGIIRDDEAALKQAFRDGHERNDVLLLAGGVSVGEYDLAPKVLADLGVMIHVHKVRMKPGKPLLFGTWGTKLVFGLPGNPVSSFVGFELFVRPALRRLMGHAGADVASQVKTLLEPLRAHHDRPTYHPATVMPGGIRPLPWFGSADLRGLLDADAFLVLPPGEVSYAPGDPVEVIRI